MILRTISLLFTILLTSNFTLSQSVNSYKVSSGEPELDDIILHKLIAEFGGAEFDSSAVDTAVRKAMRAEGYFYGELRISGIGTDNSKIEVSVTPGARAVVSSATVLGVGTDSLAVAAIWEPIAGQFFAAEKIEQKTGETVAYFEEQGFPFAAVEIVSLNIEKKDSQSVNADVLLRAVRNERSGIDSIAVQGNSKTNRGVILRELRIKPGESFREELLQNAVEQLNRLKFFHPVNPPKYFITSSGKGVLELEVSELNTNNFDGILGYVPSTKETEEGYFTGLINVSLRNLFGSGRGFWFKWEREDRKSQNLELHYLEPWVFDQPVNFSFDFYQRQQDTSYISRKISANLEFLATETIRAGVTAETESVIPTLTNSGFIQVSDSRKLTAGINLVIDTRDDVYSPTSGLYFKNAYFYSAKKLGGRTAFSTISGQSESLQRIELDVSGYYRIFGNQVAALSVKLRQVRGGLLELSDVYRFGGTNSVRGYREKQFTANRVIWSNAEYRFLLSPRTYFSLFYDSGYFSLESDIIGVSSSSTGFVDGYGLGINLETGMGVLQVSYAIGKGDSINEGKIHFGLLNEF